jgi:hypothetical protein
MIELKLNREQFSDYRRRSPNKSLKTTEEWLLFRVLARVNLALKRNRWYNNLRFHQSVYSPAFLLPPTRLLFSVARSGIGRLGWTLSRFALAGGQKDGQI